MTQFYSDDKMTNHKSHNRDTKCQQNDKSMVVPKLVVCSLLLHYCFYSLPLNTDRALRPARKSKHPNTLFFLRKFSAEWNRVLPLARAARRVVRPTDYANRLQPQYGHGGMKYGGGGEHGGPRTVRAPWSCSSGGELGATGAVDEPPVGRLLFFCPGEDGRSSAETFFFFPIAFEIRETRGGGLVVMLQ